MACEVWWDGRFHDEPDEGAGRRDPPPEADAADPMTAIDRTVVGEH